MTIFYCNGTLFDLKWLPISFRINKKVLCFVYKALNKEAPEYLCELLIIKSTPYPTRSSRKLELEIPKTNSHGDRSFGVAGPKLWNPLPEDIKDSATFDIFKRSLNEHYFNEAFQEHI